MTRFRKFFGKDVFVNLTVKVLRHFFDPLMVKKLVNITDDNILIVIENFSE